ncbi:uncharacterized protein SPSC_05731 [Sporisorium scitamineum]|uniref:Uncharacterized protein n=1 Tax=Sporisorium scitamineum TaxID=49012 RepID=A0A0F7S2G7_9BASI|nr:uncharacterized protein SPSC_05731 [Sporisorium scitamineum]CDW96066.1 hypothetical protein [Sporisorium scitamineum]
MASGLASLAGYGSDSDEEDIPHATASTSSSVVTTAPAAAPARPASSKLGALLPQPRAGLASKLPPPSSSSNGSGLSLPPPTSSTSSKRKVIKVDSLQSFQASNDGDDLDDATSTDSKKPRLGSSMQNGSTSKHSLFGMLPAPKRKDGEVLAERNKQAEARKAAKAIQDADASTSTQAPLSIDENASRATSPGTDADDTENIAASNRKPKGKNNDAFRAMLGLKLAATKHQPPPSTSIPSSSSTSIKQNTTAHVSSSKVSSQPSSTSSVVKPDPGSASSSNADAQAPVDFFSLASARSSNSTASAPHSSSFAIPSAPTVDHPDPKSSHQAVGTDDNDGDDDAAEYPGWQLDPDGSWVPVTPEAHAQLLAYQQSLPQATPSNTSTSKSASNLDGTRDLLAAGLTPEDLRAFDASDAARQAYLDANGDPADNDKYAAAAEFSAGNREVQQRKPGMLKGLRKGQLSSLVSLASENRSQLEKRWQKNREAQAQRSKRYGF